MVDQEERSHSIARGWSGVSVITASLFVFLTTELMPVGLLTPLSTSMGVSVGAAGLMVTLYGISAGLGVPFIVAWLARRGIATLVVAKFVPGLSLVVPPVAGALGLRTSSFIIFMAAGAALRRRPTTDGRRGVPRLRPFDA